VFERALGLDPDFPLALAGTAEAFALLAFYSYLPAHEATSRARAVSLRALDRAPDPPEAHATLLFISCCTTGSGTA
jgi:hypothetical protein